MLIKTQLKIISGPHALVALLDLFFILLIFFMICSSNVVFRGTLVDPPINPNAKYYVADKIIITITRNGLCFLNDKPVKQEDFEEEFGKIVESRRLASQKKLSPDGKAVQHLPIVVLNADKTRSYAEITNVLKNARKRGVCILLAEGLKNTEQSSEIFTGETQ